MRKKAEPIDMSPQAITLRLEEMRGLCDLMSYLAQFRPAVEAAERSARSVAQDGEADRRDD
jgi:hypothetical protein